MRLPTVLGLATLLAAATAGCGPTANTPTPALPTPADSSDWKRVDNLEYLNWKKFPVGTEVVRTSVTTTAGKSVTTVERFTLKAVSDDELVVDRQNTTTHSEGGYHQANPPDPRKIAPRILVHPEVDADSFRKPDPKAKRAGKEKLTVLGKEYECDKWEWIGTTDQGPMNVTAWLSDDMPGRVVKQEMKVPKVMSSAVEQVTELKVP